MCGKKIPTYKIVMALSTTEFAKFCFLKFAKTFG